MIAEYSAFEEIATLCAHLTPYDSRFAAVGRRAEDQQIARHAALEHAGFHLRRPDKRTAEISGRTYQLPDVTASAVRDLLSPAALPPPGNPDEPGNLVANESKETIMPLVQPTDPNARLNGPHPAASENGGLLAFVKRQCTVRNGVIAAAVALLGTAVYLAAMRGPVPDVTA